MGWAMVSATLVTTDTPLPSATPATTATLAIPPTGPWPTKPTATPTTPATAITEARGRPRLSPSPTSPTSAPTPHTPVTHTPMLDTAHTPIHTEIPDIPMSTAFKPSFGIDIWLLSVDPAIYTAILSL